MLGALSLLTLGLTLQIPSGGREVIPQGAEITQPVAGLERTNASAEVVNVTGFPRLKQARRITVRSSSSETNATQITVPNSALVSKGDRLVASIYLRGRAVERGQKARVEILFERSTQPWEKSLTHGVAIQSAETFTHVLVPFESVDTYAPGQAMLSVRLAFGPQTVDIGGLQVLNYGAPKSMEELYEATAGTRPLSVQALMRRSEPRQTMRGLGGNFCQPRYGSTEAMDVVGQYALDHLKVVHARIGLPLNSFTPERGVFKEDAQAKASLEALRIMARRRIPTVVSVWEGPEWMLGGPRETSRTLPKERYADCIDAIVRYLVLARDSYGAEPEYFSFNEPDYGVNFKFTPQQMADFIRQAGVAFQASGLKTRFLTADTANGSNFVAYAKPLLEDPTVAKYLGPLAFHSWDALGASEKDYLAIAELGKRHGREVWCLEAGHDAALWQRPNPWAAWDNALKTALAYERTIRLTGCTLLDYWTYQDNYPPVDKAGPKPYPVFHVMQQMESVFSAGSRVIPLRISDEKVRGLATEFKGRSAVLLINTANAGTIELQAMPHRTYQMTVSDRHGTRRIAKPLVSPGKAIILVAVPARSVITLHSVGER